MREDFRRKQGKDDQIDTILKTRNLFPQKPSARVKFAMAVANLILANFEGTPSEKNQLRIDVNWDDGTRYLWTALMVFGENHPKMSFGHKALNANDAYFKEEHELGQFWWTFSTNSLYETVFKHYLTQDMLILTENPQLFEDISNIQYKTVVEQISAKKEKIGEEVVLQNEKEQQLKKLLNDSHLFPKNPAGRVKYAMAIANLFLANREPPSEHYPVYLKGAVSLSNLLLKYLWTALMVFGQRHPHARYTHKAIDIVDIQCSAAVNKELGGTWSTFSKTSLYETEFKHHLTEEMLVLTENPELFEGISNQIYTTLAEQIRAKEEGPFKSLPQMLESPHNKGIKQASKMQWDKPSIAKASSSPSSSSGKETKQSALELAQLTEENKPDDFKQVFSSYLHAARSGHNEALVSLERLAQEANKDQQLALSQLYGSFFNNPERAAYWRQKATEIAQPSFDIQFS